MWQNGGGGTHTQQHINAYTISNDYRRRTLNENNTHTHTTRHKCIHHIKRQLDTVAGTKKKTKNNTHMHIQHHINACIISNDYQMWSLGQKQKKYTYTTTHKRIHHSKRPPAVVVMTKKNTHTHTNIYNNT